jgi:hypothetical protein
VATTLLETALERMWSEAVAGDKAYSTGAMRTWLREREIEPVIPPRRDELGETDYHRAHHQPAQALSAHCHAL